MRQRRDTHLESNTGKTADDFIHIQDPLCDGFGIADEQRTCPSPKLDRRNRVDFSISYREQSTDMPEFLLRLVRLVWLFARGQQALVLENIALRQQWAVFKRHRKYPRLNRSDRVFWIVLAKFWKNWRRALIIVHPDTVVRGQRQRFRRYWAHLSCEPGKRIGLPPVSKQIREPIQTIAGANPLWRAPRIPGELLKLAIEVSERTVSRILHTFKRPPSQTWGDFLTEPHRGDRCGQFLHRADGQTAGAVRVPCSGTSP